MVVANDFVLHCERNSPSFPGLGKGLLISGKESLPKLSLTQSNIALEVVLLKLVYIQSILVRLFQELEVFC